MPDLIPADHGICDRHPKRIEITGFRLEFVPYLMRGRNDKKWCFSIFCEFIITNSLIKSIPGNSNENMLIGQ